MTTHEVLVAARNLIDREGWGSSIREVWCVLGAIGKVTGIGVDFSPGCRAFKVHALGKDSHADIGEWNDAPGRTKAEVLAAFDKAIAATAPPPADPFTSATGCESLAERPRLGGPTGTPGATTSRASFR